MKPITVTRPFVGLCHMQVCVAGMPTDEEILDVCNTENPSGTRNGWSTVIRDDSTCGPVPCNIDPSRTHYLVGC